MNKLVFGLLAAAALCAGAPAFAWSEGGHRVSGIIAARLVDDPTRDAVVALLREHPFYTQDFVQQPKDAAEAEWLFSQAAQWPDIARGYEGQHHGSWHFINLPMRLPGAEAIEWQQNTSREWSPEMDVESLNVVQAIVKAQADVANTALPGADRAVALCWLFHLIGDIHQPCHVATLVTATRFPEGDRGANEIRTAGGEPLHGYWDGLLGRGESWKKVSKRADNLMTWADFRIAAERGGAQLDAETWLQESLGVADEYVYTIGVREHVLRNEHCAELPPKKLNYQYKFQARDAAYTRVAQSGYRLAAVLEGLF